jgi:hypothetical protein
MKTSLITLLLSLSLLVGGALGGGSQQAAAHNYDWQFHCFNTSYYTSTAGWIGYWRHVYVNWGRDYHDWISYYMSYPEWDYYCSF